MSDTHKYDYDKYSLQFSCYILPIVLKQHFIFCLLWLYTHYMIVYSIDLKTKVLLFILKITFSH